MSLTYPLKQGFLHSLKSVEIREGGALFKGITGFKFTIEIDGRESVFGTGTLRYGVTRGGAKVSIEMEFEVTSGIAWAKQRAGLLMLKQDVVASVREDGQSNKLEFLGLVFDKLDGAYESGPSKLTIPGTCDDFKLDGVSMVTGDALGQSGEGGAQ